MPVACSPTRVGSEGGLSSRRTLRDLEKHDGMGGNREYRLERAGGPRSGRGAGGASTPLPEVRPELYGGGALQIALPRCCRPTLSGYEDWGRRARVRRPASRGRLLPGGPRGHRWTQMHGSLRASRLGAHHRGRAGARLGRHRRALSRHHPLCGPGQGGRHSRGRPHTAHRQPRARPAAPRGLGHRPRRSAPGGPARGA